MGWRRCFLLLTSNRRQMSSRNNSRAHCFRVLLPDHRRPAMAAGGRRMRREGWTLGGHYQCEIERLPFDIAECSVLECLLGRC